MTIVTIFQILSLTGVFFLFMGVFFLITKKWYNHAAGQMYYTLCKLWGGMYIITLLILLFGK